jgi:hypothetical protein
VPRFTTCLRDALVEFGRATQCRLDGLYDDPPRSFAQRVSEAGVLVNTVDDSAEQVELILGLRSVAHSHRPAAAVAREMIEVRTRGGGVMPSTARAP